MFKNLIFALLFAASLSSCAKGYWPDQYVDETGIYTRVHGNVYHKKGDRITSKGYREYKLTGGKFHRTEGNSFAGK
jgi:hypothetical protein